MPMFSKVIVVDDSLVDRRLVGELLGKDPFLQIEFAENGVEALELIKTVKPNLVLTDLRMPGMDGLELVRNLQLERPLLPVVVTTAYGSGDMALEALAQGAASYIPKSQLMDRLLYTVQGILTRADSRGNVERLTKCQRSAEFSFSLENKSSLIQPLCALLRESAANMQFLDTSGRIQIVVALEQALLNALYHGNLEVSYEQIIQECESLAEGKPVKLMEQRRHMQPYCDRRIHVDLRISQQEMKCVIRDEGPGFDVCSLPDPSDPSTLESEGGHGLVLMHAFMDEVIFNEKGNQVTMIRRS